jgi:hypothetical protein
LNERARQLIETLALEPHPEGGWYRETWRRESDAGPVGTAIYYLLAAGHCSRLHRLYADEVWHLYEGGPVVISRLGARGPEPVRLEAAAPQAVVPAGAWFGAELGPDVQYALLGCTMAPGFEFDRFEPGERRELERDFPHCLETIRRLTPGPEGTA